MPTPKEIQKLSYQKAVRLEKLIDEVEKRIARTSSQLTKTMLQNFAAQLNVEKGRIVSQLNRETITLFNKAYANYTKNFKTNFIKSIVDDLDNILDDNDNFYKRTVERETPKAEIKKLINRRLGIRENGTLIRQGYMSGLLDDATIKSEIQRHIFREVFRNSGLEAFKKSIKTLIEGETNKFGLFQRHYKTFSFDVYAQLNSFIAANYAQKLGLTHFIYNGGLIETSREFCRKRNAGIFSTAEAEKWKDDPTLTAIDNRDSYNWLIDRGGYNCRHTLDFIADEVAFVLRPDLKK